MTEPSTEKLGAPDPPKAIALMVLACISGFIVWSFHNADWPAFTVALVLGGFLGLLAGGLVGVHLVPTLGVMAGFSGLFEGIIQGWSLYGIIGAIVGGPLGAFAASIIVMLPIMLIHFVVIVCGIDPFANRGSSKNLPPY